MKKVAKINYVKVFILAIITIFIVVVLANVYRDKKQYERANEDVMSFLSTVKYEELNEYLVENADGFIYISSSSDTSLDSFELKFKEYILSEDLEKDFVYLDSSEFSNAIYTNLKDSYFSENISKQINIGRSSLLAVEHGQVIAILDINFEDNGLEEVKEFINNHEVVE